MNRYTIGSRETDATTTIMLDAHRQHIWSESHAAVSRKTAARVRKTLGDGPYTNPEGNFGRAQRVYLEIA